MCAKWQKLNALQLLYYDDFYFPKTKTFEEIMIFFHAFQKRTKIKPNVLIHFGKSLELAELLTNAKMGN